MSKSNKDFFKEKKEWSKIKDDLLGCYLKPYFQKVLMNGRPIHYVDCFAGEGKFKSGESGSPLIAIDAATEVLGQTKNKSIALNQIKLTFIEKEFAAVLKDNIASHNNQYPNYEIIQGSYQDLIEGIIRASYNQNLFLYIDPYGIKNLQYSVFERLQTSSLKSAEILVNFNSFGFFRNVCRAMNIALRDDEYLWADDEDELTPVNPNNLSSLLTSVFGGSEWMNIGLEYKACIIDSRSAEKKISSFYIANLKKVFTYVVDIPIRLSSGHQPKYRMIHACNHPDGCFLMINNIQQRKTQLIENVYNPGQMMLDLGLTERTSLDNDFISESEIRDTIIEILEKQDLEIRYRDLINEFYSRQGIVCSFQLILSVLQNFETSNKISVRRDPPTTPSGAPSKYWTESKGNRIFIKLNESQRIH